MTPWKLQHDVAHRTYERLLGRNELGFYWDSRFNGTADTLRHAIVEITDTQNQNLFSLGNCTRAWVALKQQFPLLGAHLAKRKEGEVVFIVGEDRLKTCGPEEISIQRVSSLAEADEFVDNMINGKRPLSDELLARLVILPRADQMSHVHILIHVAHCITDGIANTTLLKCLLDGLSSTYAGEMWNLEERLALAVASEDLVPTKHFNGAKSKWHWAMGQVLASVRLAKITGGHTLPRKFTQATPYSPAYSGLTTLSFSIEKSKQIINRCREHGLTFGNVFPVLAQVALTRILCRQYVCGKIGAEEWEYRKREPMSTGGPLNLRPFLDQGWFKRGGDSNICLSIAPGDDLPGFADLLSFPRFLLRCHSIKWQSFKLTKHPLFPHSSASRSAGSIDRVKSIALHWRKEQGELDNHVIPVMEQGPVFAYACSTIGNVDHLLPRDYPISPATSSGPSLHLHTSEMKLHCRPAELYLGASMAREQLHFNIFWDMNVFDKEIVREWLQEVGSAAEFFLGEVGSSPEMSQARL